MESGNSDAEGWRNTLDLHSVAALSFAKMLYTIWGAKVPFPSAERYGNI